MRTGTMAYRRQFPRLRSLGLAVALAVAVAGPAQAGLFSDEDARKATADLRAEVLQRNTADDARFAHIESSIDTLQQANQKLQASIDRLDQAIRNLGLAALASQVDGIGQDLARLRGQVEVQGNDAQQAQKRSKEFYLDLDTRLHVLEQAAAKAAEAGKAADATHPADASGRSGDADGAASGQPALAGVNPPVAVAPGRATPPSPPSLEESTAYDKAYRAYTDASYAPALKGFQAFAKRYPNSIYAPNVAYWIGMTHYRMKALPAAVTSLKGVVASFPESPKAADALLSLAAVQLEQNDTVGAHQSLEDLINRYPGSDAAVKAKAKLGRK